jgi:hypothetical protein
MVAQLLAGLRSMSQRAMLRMNDRGDVPGWVLITLMTVGIVMALWVVAEPKLSSLLGNALDVSGDPNGK